MRLLCSDIVARAVALFLGGFSLLNILGDLRTPGFDANEWWIDFRPFPALPARALLLAASVALVAYGFRPQLALWRRRATLLLVVALLAVTVWNVVHFYMLVARGTVYASFPIPFSLIVATSLLIVILALVRPYEGDDRLSQKLIGAIAFLACIIGFPFAQMVCFGNTDYRRPADAIVVFGARTYASGHLSQALRDRVSTACQLYFDGFAPRLIFSGGPGDGKVHETEAMRRYAVRHGVADADIVCDTQGLSTYVTVKNTCPMFKSLHIRRVLAVSHFYHLPRVKMAYRRAGWNVYTLPAHQSSYMSKLPYLILREEAALWAYYLRG